MMSWIFSERRQHVIAWSVFVFLALLSTLLGCGHAEQLRRSASVAERAIATADVIVTEHVRAYARAMDAQTEACMREPVQTDAARETCMAAFKNGDEVAELVERIVAGLEASDDLVDALVRLSELMADFERAAE